MIFERSQGMWDDREHDAGIITRVSRMKSLRTLPKRNDEYDDGL